MSFTTTIKTELSSNKLSKIEELSELSGFLKNSQEGNDKLKITTENVSVARFVFNLIKKNYKSLIKVSVRKGYNYNKNFIYNLDVYKGYEEVIEDLSLDKDVPKDYLIDDNDTKRAYLRGVFLATGSINDPKKSRYHLEFAFSNYNYTKFINDILLSYDLNSKILKRDTRYIVYIKEAEKICDFLRIINAVNALLYYENIRIYHNKKNNLNRLNNCEQANVDKIIQTAKDQIDNINYLKYNEAYDLLNEKVKVACEYRLKYPEESLLELSKIMTIETGINITKSGLHHRFNKLKELVEKIKNKKTEE